MLKLGFVPLEVMLTLPLAAPLVVGEKSTVKEVLWPAFNVKGKVSPLRLNPLPLAVAAEMVRLDPPELVSVSCATPVPESGIVKLESEAVEVMLMLPLAAPLVVGEKSTVNDVL